MERDVAEKALDLMMKTWSDNGQASDQTLQAGIEESLKVSSSKQSVLFLAWLTLALPGKCTGS